MPKVDKVVFLVDRIALTNQTKDDYLAYDPEAGRIVLAVFEKLKIPQPWHGS